MLLRAFLWLKISDLSFHYSSESKGIAGQAERNRGVRFRCSGKRNDDHCLPQSIEGVIGKDDAGARFLNFGSLGRIETDPPHVTPKDTN